MKPQRIYDIAYDVAEEKKFDPNEAPYKFAAEVAKRACEQHVQAAIEAALLVIKIKYDYSDSGNCGEFGPDIFVDQEAIRNSYPLNNIK
jgi:hypothetical protein